MICGVIYVLSCLEKDLKRNFVWILVSEQR